MYKVSTSFSILSLKGIGVSLFTSEFGVIIPNANIGKLLIFDSSLTSFHPANLFPPYTAGCNFDLLGFFLFKVIPFLLGPIGL